MPSEWDEYYDLHSEYFSDKNYLPVSYSNIKISKTHLNPPKPW